MNKIYKIEIMGHEDPTYCTQEDVARIVEATNRGLKLVLVRQALINPASVSRVQRAYDVDERALDKADEELNTLLKAPAVKQLK